VCAVLRRYQGACQKRRVVSLVLSRRPRVLPPSLPPASPFPSACCPAPRAEHKWEAGGAAVGGGSEMRRRVRESSPRPEPPGRVQQAGNECPQYACPPVVLPYAARCRRRRRATKRHEMPVPNHQAGVSVGQEEVAGMARGVCRGAIQAGRCGERARQSAGWARSPARKVWAERMC